MDELRDISSDQEEAGTKMFLFAKYCALLGASSVCIHTVDTDVLVLSGNKLLLSLFQFFRYFVQTWREPKHMRKKISYLS